MSKHNRYDKSPIVQDEDFDTSLVLKGVLKGVEQRPDRIFEPEYDEAHVPVPQRLVGSFNGMVPLDTSQEFDDPGYPLYHPGGFRVIDDLEKYTKEFEE